ncbi:hypothetical protein AB1N83_014154, partial [Pleurotus pulmonarius]
PTIIHSIHSDLDSLDLAHSFSTKATGLRCHAITILRYTRSAANDTALGDGQFIRETPEMHMFRTHFTPLLPARLALWLFKITEDATFRRRFISYPQTIA